MAAAAAATAEISAAVAAEVARPKDLIDVIGLVALNGYKVDAFRCMALSRAFCEDRGLTEAVVNLQHGWQQFTLLMCAAEHGWIQRAEQLCAFGADVNLQDKLGWTAAYRAYRRKHEAMMRLLLQQPKLDSAAHVEILAWLGMTERVVAALQFKQNITERMVVDSLMAACRCGHRDTAVAILAACPDFDVNAHLSDFDLDTLLIWMLPVENIHTVAVMLSLPGVDVNAADRKGLTPLHVAVAVADTDKRRALLKLLLAAPGASLNVRTEGSQTTPLMYAAACGCADAVTDLLAAPGIDVNAVDAHGKTALRYAAGWGKSASISALLAAPGIDVAVVDARGRTALQLAQHKAAHLPSWRAHAQQGFAECISLLQGAAPVSAATGIEADAHDA